MFTFATDYYLLVLVAGIGTIQFAASLSDLKGLLFFQRPLLSRGLGLALIVLAFVWFFSVSERNISDHDGALDANTQALFFFLAVLSSGTFTFVVSSIVNRGMTGSRCLSHSDTESGPESGMDSLRHLSFYYALVASIDYWWNNWRTQIRRYLFG